jgi:HEAT repeat protein
MGALKRLLDSHWSVRKEAAALLKLHRDPATDQVLLQVAEEDDDQSVRQAAREALGS